MLQLKSGEADVNTLATELGMDSLITITTYKRSHRIDVLVIEILSVYTPLRELCKDGMIS